jgi:hypothetical protein
MTFQLRRLTVLEPSPHLGLSEAYFPSLTPQKQGRVIIGITELFAAVGLILPGITHILPWLTPLAATGLVIVMVGSVIYHQRRRETKHMRSSGIALLIVPFVALIY